MEFTTLKLVIPRDIVFREPAPGFHPGWSIPALIDRYRQDLLRLGFDMEQLIRWAYDPQRKVQVLYQNRCDAKVSELN